jgi:hypothetical protein
MPDLTKSFGAPATTLGGLLPSRPAPRPRPAEQDETAEVGEQAEVERTTTATTPTDRDDEPSKVRSGPSRQVRGGGRQLRPAPAEQGHTQTFQTIAYVSAAVKMAVDQRRRRDRVTNAEIVLNALDEVYDDLAGLVASHRTVTRSEESLFPARRITPRASSPSTRKVPITFQATAVELQIINDLVNDFGADSLSELVAVALEHVLISNRGRRR